MSAIPALGLEAGVRERIPRVSGLLLVDKPAGRTSHDLVDHVRRRLGERAVGHLGTLDPAATGLLVMAIGAATRCGSVWQGGVKTYEGTARFGVVTSTQDLAGTVLEERSVEIDEARIRAAAESLTGDLEQIPPMVSALKVDGQRLYRLARRGIEVERAPRPIRVEEWEWLAFEGSEARFRVRCSPGTYVRTLVHDLGQLLGTGAALAALRRLRSEPFGIERAATWDDLDRLETAELWERSGLDLEVALETLPAIVLDREGADLVGFGGRPVVASAEAPPPHVPISGGPRSVVLRGPDGRALALGELLLDSGLDRLVACPHLVLPWAVKSSKS